MAEETLEEAAKRHADSYYNKNSEFCSVIYESVEWINRNYNFIVGAEWQAERMYSEEDLKLAFVKGHDSARLKGSYKFNGTFEEDWMLWFEQFKKK